MQQLSPAWASVFDQVRQLPVCTLTLQPELLFGHVEDSLHKLIESLCDVMVNCSSSAQVRSGLSR